MRRGLMKSLQFHQNLYKFLRWWSIIVLLFSHNMDFCTSCSANPGDLMVTSWPYHPLQQHDLTGNGQNESEGIRRGLIERIDNAPTYHFILLFVSVKLKKTDATVCDSRTPPAPNDGSTFCTCHWTTEWKLWGLRWFQLPVVSALPWRNTMEKHLKLVHFMMPHAASLITWRPAKCWHHFIDLSLHACPGAWHSSNWIKLRHF